MKKIAFLVFVGFLCVIFGCAPSNVEVKKEEIPVSVEKCTVSKDVPYNLDGEDYKATIMENSLIKVIVLPDYGARIIEYVLKSTGHNQFDPEAGNPGLKDIVGEYGQSGYSSGCFFCMEPYKIDFNKKDNGEVSVLAYVSSDAVKVERNMTIYPGSTRLNINVKYTNIGDEVIEGFKVRIHPIMAIGGKGNAEHTILIPQGDEIVNVKEATSVKAQKGWWLGFATKEREAVILTYNPSEVDEVSVYIGGESYNMEYTGKPKDAKKGDSVSLECNYWIVKSAEEVNKLIGSKEINLTDAEQAKLKTEITALFAGK